MKALHHGREVDFDPRTRTVRRRGLGDWVGAVIDGLTFGQGNRLAAALARKFGAKGCGCQRRKSALNRWDRKWGLTR